MSYIEDIQNRKNEVRNNIAKGFGCEFVKAQDDELGEIEKAVYADTAQNRKLGRVGKEYHRGKGKKEDDEKNDKHDMLDSNGKLNKNSKLVQRMWHLESKMDNKTATDAEIDEFGILRNMARGMSKEDATIQNKRNKHSYATSKGIAKHKNEEWHGLKGKTTKAEKEYQKKQNKNSNIEIATFLDGLTEYYEGKTDDLSPKLVKQFKSAAKELGTMELAKKMFKYWSDPKNNKSSYAQSAYSDDEIKEAVTSAFEEFGVKIDKETKKFLKI